MVCYEGRLKMVMYFPVRYAREARLSFVGSAHKTFKHEKKTKLVEAEFTRAH